MTEADQGMPNYYSMSGPELLKACGDDASKWAAAFCQIKKAQGWSADDIDEGLMISWFANAIEHSGDVRNGTGPTVLPDGSAFVVA